jgi:hypothetical protein
MSKRTQVTYVSSGRSRPQEHREHHWQDPTVRMLMERLGKDSPLMGAAMVELLILRRLGEQVTTEVMGRVIDKVEEAHRRGHAIVPVSPIQPPAQRARRGRFSDIEVGSEVVYYMRIGNRIKIGTSTNLADRLRAVNPEELMCVEAGGPGKERLRHEQFADLRTHGEWFRHEGSLAEHIQSIRQETGRDRTLRGGQDPGGL